MAIDHWPEEQRPRERLIKHGPQILSDAELLAVFLRVGVSGKSAVDLGRDMIGHFKFLHGLFTATLADFSESTVWGWQNMRNSKQYWNWHAVR